MEVFWPIGTEKSMLDCRVAEFWIRLVYISMANLSECWFIQRCQIGQVPLYMHNTPLLYSN